MIGGKQGIADAPLQQQAKEVAMKRSNHSSSPMLLSSAMIIGLLLATMAGAHASADEAPKGDCNCNLVESERDDVICHIPPGNHQNMHTIRVAEPAVQAHLNHGDIPGVCPGDDVEVESEASVAHASSSCLCEDGTTGSWQHVPAAVKAYSQRSVFGQ